MGASGLAGPSTVIRHVGLSSCRALGFMVEGLFRAV